jgi:antitoxin (DNA-binding transcriptional repressor) of toxin-antitoxin stability system
VVTLTERIGIRELRDSLTTTIRRVREGESFEVTYHGVPIALIAPVPTSRLDRLIASGEVSPPRQALRGPFRPLPPTGSMTASEALEDDRADR